MHWWCIFHRQIVPRVFWLGGGVATRLAAVLGPLTYGAATWMINNNHWLAMLITGVFFLLALIVLMRVDERRGRAAITE